MNFVGTVLFLMTTFTFIINTPSSLDMSSENVSFMPDFRNMALLSWRILYSVYPAMEQPNHVPASLKSYDVIFHDE